MSDYWKDRTAAAQTALSNKNTKQVEAQLKKYYSKTMNSVISSFEATYDKLLATMEKGQQPTPADLYKLDKYWAMQGQLKEQLQKLGARQATALSKVFETNYFEVYHSINLKGVKAFRTIDTAAAKQMINSVWCADNKSWSERVWGNINKLQETLNEGLINCVVTGKKTTELKKTLQERFGVSYRQADTIARTEIAHIQTEAAKKRYEDYGVEKVQFWADPDERTCPECGKLHEKIYPVGASVPLPLHPNCRCCLIPVIDEEEKQQDIIQEEIKQAEAITQPIEEPQQEIRKPVNGRDIIGENEPDLQNFDYAIESTAHTQGFDRLPQVATAEEFDKAVQASGFYAERTYTADSLEQLEEYKDMLRNGKWYIDCSEGGAQYGQGMYCAGTFDINDSTKINGIAEEMLHYQALGQTKGRQYSFTEGITLQPNAKILNLPRQTDAYEYIGALYNCEYIVKYAPAHLKAQAEAYKQATLKRMSLTFKEPRDYIDAIYAECDKYGKDFEEMIFFKATKAMQNANFKGTKEKRYKDAGVLAMEMGYDAINAEGHGKSGSYIVILNRSKVILNQGGSKYGN